jgi:calcineurin-like phosphoesterase family protein
MTAPRHWFTADTHFDHANVIRYAGRPFDNVEAMDEALVANWNARVQPGDWVYHLGDFAFCKPERALWFARRLAGNKCLVFGNHDKRLRREDDLLKQFCWARDLTEIKVQDETAPDGVQRIVLCHYAMRVWNRSHYGAWQLYGHSHGSLKDDPHALQLDVGVDAWAYRPVSYEEIRARMKQKEWRPVDHHERRE